MWLFIVSDSITFAALLFAYSYVRLSNVWPTPFHGHSIVTSTAMTFVLLSSSLTMVLAVDAANKKLRDKAVLWTMLTALGGLIFVVLHTMEWLGIINDHLMPLIKAGEETKSGWTMPMVWGTFFAATGMHMLHVTVGVGYLVVLALQYKNGKFKAIDIEVAGLYWHFVDLVWMFVFPLIYLMSAKI
ncbi:MAG: cytochrome c oxidase subunit 3 [Planctomycetota bacterium]|nr:cytochrome c oxidase subunit 3 [Planctomycetota bacterium]